MPIRLLKVMSDLSMAAYEYCPAGRPHAESLSEIVAIAQFQGIQFIIGKRITRHEIYRFYDYSQLIHCRQ